MTDVLVKKGIDQSELFKNQREPKSISERRLYSFVILGALECAGTIYNVPPA